MLQVENLSIFRKDELLLQTGKIDFLAGKKYLIVAESTKGKTVFLKTLLKRHSNYQGRITSDLEKSKQVIIINSQSTINNSQSIIENIIFPNKEKSVIKRIPELWKMLNLFPALNEAAMTLSFTEKKAVEILRAVLQKPHLLVVDDLDKLFNEMMLTKILALLEQLQNKGTTVIATSNYRIDDFDFVYILKKKQLCLI